jgi:hypothetical protein
MITLICQQVAKCQWGDDPNKGGGYMIHESARWSDVHKRWFFFPRKLSRQTYDQDNDEKKCCNLMLSCDADFSAESVVAQPLLTFKELRGCSDFFFVPDTNDTHLFAIRTEETRQGDVHTFASVLDLEGNILMEEKQVAGNRKFEGVCPAPKPLCKCEKGGCSNTHAARTSTHQAAASGAQAGALQGQHVMGLMGAASAEKPSTHQAAASAAPADDMFSIEADSAGDQSAAPDTSAQPEAKAKDKGAKKNDAKAEVAHRLPPRQRAAQRRVWQMEVGVNAKKDAETAKEEKSEAETVKKGAEERAKKEAEGKAKAKEAEEEEEEAKKKKIHLISWGAVKFQANWRRIQARTAMIAHAAEQNTLLSMPGTIQGRSGWYEFDEKGERFVVAYNVTEAGAWEVQKGPMKKNFWLEAKQLKAESTGN